MRARRRSLAVAGILAAAALAALATARTCAPAPPPERTERAGSPAPREARPFALAPPRFLPLPSPSDGWQDAAETVAIDVRRFLVGEPAAGAYEEARAEAARADLALFPPDPAELRRMLLSFDERLRMLALAALAARADATDDLLRIVLREQRPADDDVVRLLGAEVVAALPAALVARHEQDLLRAFEREPNPLVLAVALPALERMEEPRLRALLESQLSLSAPEMIPVLVALARARLGPEALESVGVIVR